MSFEKDFFFLEGPGFFVDDRIKMIVPPSFYEIVPLSNLFGSPTISGHDFLHLIWDQSPFLFAMLIDQIRNNLIFLSQWDCT